MPQNNEREPQSGSKRAAEQLVSLSTRAKRGRYVSNACDECKRRKVRCDGENPCQRCMTQLVACSYRPRSQTRNIPDTDDLQRMNAKMLSMQDKVEQVLHQLNPSKTPRDLAPHTTSTRDVDMQTSPESALSSPVVDEPQQCTSDLASDRGPTSSGFAVDVAKGRLQAIGLNPIESEAPSRDELDLSASCQNLGDFGQFKRMVVKDPLWRIDRLEARRLIQVFANGTGSMYPIVNIETLLARSESLYSTMALSMRGQSTSNILPAAEALFSHETEVLKLVLAIGLALESCGKSQTAQNLCDSIDDVRHSSLWAPPSLGKIVILVLMALYHYHVDDEVRAGRATCVAVRLCLEMGLNRSETFKRKHNLKQDQSLAVRVFWSVYMLDRRSSIGLGVPFIIQDSDIDTSLPRPLSRSCHNGRQTPDFGLVDGIDLLQDVNDLYLHFMVGFTRISGTACRRTSSLRDSSVPLSREDAEYLDFQVLQWRKTLPEALKLELLQLQTNQDIDVSNQRLLFLRAALGVRTYQLRNLIYRPVLYSFSRISADRSHAQAAVEIARESVQFLFHLHRRTSLVGNHPVFFKHFLVSAFAAILLAVANAPSDYGHQVRDEFYMALDLFKILSTKSETMLRVWKTFSKLETIGAKLGIPRVHASTDEALQSTNTQPSPPPSGVLPSWHPGESDEAFLDLNGALTPQLRNELSNLFDPAGSLLNMFDFGSTENIDSSAYIQ